MVNAVSGNYNEWIANLNARGIKTTHLGSNEANFANYTSALSESLKQEIASSFDCKADYDLQAKLAGLYGSKSVMQSGDIVSAAKANGIQVSVQYVNTSYIVDNKKGGKYANNKNATNGSIAVYTFKDANGGEIKIADANGNGALETEELFMNELLSGVVSDISAGSGGVAVNSTQNNMQSKIDALLEQMQEQIEEQQKRIEEMANQIASMNFEQQDVEIADKKTENKDNKEDDEADIEKAAKKAIQDRYPELTDAEVQKYLDDVMEKITKSGISADRAAYAVIGELEAA